METDFARDTSYPIPISTTFLSESAEMKPLAAEIAGIHRAKSQPRAVVSPWALSRSRRMIDAAVAVIALVVFFPVFGLVALGVRLSSPGPMLFKQKRMGRNGCVFTLYKFRSMRVAEDHSSPITVSGDNRITPLGRLLRKFKLDELPQFWNVLCGDMSLVGPRPKLPHHEGLHMPFRPGITGAATLAFRFEEEMLSQIPRQHLDAYYDRFVKPSKAKIDWDYMRSATLHTDIAILFETAKSCISNRPTSYRVDLPEFTDAVHETVLRHSETRSEPALSVGAI